MQARAVQPSLLRRGRRRRRVDVELVLPPLVLVHQAEAQVELALLEQEAHRQILALPQRRGLVVARQAVLHDRDV
jgi:hypothetical protein